MKTKKLIALVKNLEFPGRVYDILMSDFNWSKEDLGPKWLFKTESWLYDL